MVAWNQKYVGLKNVIGVLEIFHAWRGKYSQNNVMKNEKSVHAKNMKTEFYLTQSLDIKKVTLGEGILPVLNQK